MRAAGLFVIVFVTVAGCGAVTVAGAGDTAGPELAELDGGAAEAHLEAPPHDAADAEAHLEAPPHDAAAECPATPPLTCTGTAGACPQGWLMASRSICGGPAFPVCCPAADCEIQACEPCPSCAF